MSQRCLGILARVLLSRQQKALLVASCGMDIPECVQVWHRLLDTLGNMAVQELVDASAIQGMVTS